MENDGWIEWNGVGKPKVGGDVGVHYQIRCIHRSMAERGAPIAARKLRWAHDGGPGDIIAWKRA